MRVYNLGGVDYTSGPFNITISAGMANATLNISILDDNVLEGNEVFLVTIDQISLSSVVISNGSTLAVIIDDDRKCLNNSKDVTIYIPKYNTQLSH